LKLVSQAISAKRVRKPTGTRLSSPSFLKTQSKRASEEREVNPLELLAITFAG
jgi:hypothetical protein